MKKFVCSLVLSLTVLSLRPGWGETPAFSTPEEAVQAFKVALAAKDEKPLLALFGPELPKLLDPSPEVRKESRRLVQTLLKERWKCSSLDEERKVLRLGNEGWPFPVTLVKAADGWKFDTAAGVEEVRNRRIGTNELINLETLTCLHRAQQDYFGRYAQKDGLGRYSSAFRSAKGKRDGLYWDVKAGEDPSPLEAALKDSAQYARGRTQGAPWWGYRYHFLTGQGSHAAGGALDYNVNGSQVKGWAVIASPVSYGSSGFQSFICNQNGVIYEKDLGPDTAILAREITLFDPDDSWQPVDAQDLPPRSK